MLHDLVTNTVQFVIDFTTQTGAWGVWLLMVLDALNLPLPSEIILGFAGYLVSTGQFSFWFIAVVAALGSLSGAVLSYWIGLVGGRPFIKKYGRWLLFAQKDLDTADRLFKKYGSSIVFFARFLPLLRTLISIPAGVTKMKFWKFMVYTFLGSLTWSTVLLYLGVKVGENYLHAADRFQWLEYVVVIALGVGLAWWIYRFIKQSREEKKQAKDEQSS